MDTIPLTRTVLFVGDYFSLMTTVTLEELYRQKDESDEDYAVRLASDFMLNHYGWDVAAAATVAVGVMDDEYDDEGE